MPQNTPRTSRYVGDFAASDPVSKAPVEMEIHIDSATGGMFAVDFSFIDQVREQVFSPFDGTQIELQQPPDQPESASAKDRPAMAVLFEMEAFGDGTPPVAGLKFMVDERVLADLRHLVTICTQNNLSELRRICHPEWLYPRGEAPDGNAVRGLEAPKMCVRGGEISFTGCMHADDYFDNRVSSAPMDLATLQESFKSGVKLLVLVSTDDAARSFLDRVNVSVGEMVPGRDLRVFGPWGEVTNIAYTATAYREHIRWVAPRKERGG